MPRPAAQATVLQTSLPNQASWQHSDDASTILTLPVWYVTVDVSKHSENVMVFAFRFCVRETLHITPAWPQRTDCEAELHHCEYLTATSKAYATLTCICNQTYNEQRKTIVYPRSSGHHTGLIHLYTWGTWVVAAFIALGAHHRCKANKCEVAWQRHSQRPGSAAHGGPQRTRQRRQRHGHAVDGAHLVARRRLHT